MICILIGANAAIAISYQFSSIKFQDLAFGFLYAFYTYLIYIFASKIIKGPNGKIKLRLFLISMVLFIICVTLFSMYIDINNLQCERNKQFSILRATGFIEQVLFYFIARKMRKKMIIQNQYDLMLDSRLKKLTSLVISCFLSGLVLFAENIIYMAIQSCVSPNYKELYNFLTIIISGIIPSQICFIIFWPPKKIQLTVSQQSAETQSHAYYKNLIIKKDSRESKLPQSESQRSAISV